MAIQSNLFGVRGKIGNPGCYMLLVSKPLQVYCQPFSVSSSPVPTNIIEFPDAITSKLTSLSSLSPISETLSVMITGWPVPTFLKEQKSNHDFLAMSDKRNAVAVIVRSPTALLDIDMVDSVVEVLSDVVPYHCSK
jgi:hypothetical protein